MASDQSEHTNTEDMSISHWSEVTTSMNLTMSAEITSNKDGTENSDSSTLQLHMDKSNTHALHSPNWLETCKTYLSNLMPNGTKLTKDKANQTMFDDEQEIDALLDKLDEIKLQMKKMLDKEANRLKDREIESTNIDAARNHFQPDPEEHQSFVQQPSNLLEWIRSLKFVPLEIKRRVCLPSVVIPEIGTDSLWEYFKKVVWLLLFYIITCLRKLVLLSICCIFCLSVVLDLLYFLLYYLPIGMFDGSPVLVLTVGYYALIGYIFLILIGFISLKPRFSNLLPSENR